jgi:hypothetical protein
MKEISGFARVMARIRVNQELNPRILGKPYLKFGQCVALGRYFFQWGGMLGDKHQMNLDAFGDAFLGAAAAPGAVKRLFTELANDIVTRSGDDSMTFYDYVSEEFSRGVGYVGDPASLFIKHGLDKIAPEIAVDIVRRYAVEGAALGVIYPDVLRKMYERSYAAVPKGQWDEARSAGLNIPAEQFFISYDELREADNEVFMAYCQKCCPDLYTILSGERAVARPIDSKYEQHQPKSHMAAKINMSTRPPKIGTDIPWADILRHLFRVLEFDRAGTTIGPKNQLQALADFTPYGYLLVESPILSQTVRLPIVHRDDFWLAASVFDEPNLVDLINDEELLVTYAPKKVLARGLAGDTSHALHYVITPRGTLDRYYASEADDHMAKPVPERLLGAFVYEGEIKVQLNFEPEF